MSQKRNKIIVLVSIVIVIFMSSIYLYNYFFNSDTVILRSIKKCENFLHSNYYVSEENIAYHPSPAVNCVKSKSEVSLIEFNKIDATLKEIKSNQKLIKSINLNAELAIYEQIQ